MRTATPDTASGEHKPENPASPDAWATGVHPPQARERRRQISISGTIGSGKSTVAHAIAQMLGWEYLSSGAAQRDIARSLNLSTLELNRVAETDTGFDDRLDEMFGGLKNRDAIVIDSRMAWHFLADSFKVSLTISPGIAARRVLRDQTRLAEDYADEAAAESDIIGRSESERKRFQRAYKIDVGSADNYDLVIDTADLAAKSVGNLIFANYVLWQEKMAHAAAIVAPHRLRPTQDARTLDGGIVAEAQARFSRAGFPLSAAPSVLYRPPDYFLIGDHHAVCAAMRSNISVIPVTLKREIATVERLIAEAATPERLRDWEAVCGCRHDKV